MMQRAQKQSGKEHPARPTAPKAQFEDSVTRRQVFARNLDRLLTVVGLSRKDAAEELGIPYSLIRRFVSFGLSRRDERNANYLETISRYFHLPDVDSLWRSDLLDRLLASGEGRPFVEEFRPRLEAQRQAWLAKLAEVDPELLRHVSGALGFYSEAQRTGRFEEDLEKVRAILSSPEADLFRQLIERFFVIASPRETISLRDTEED